MSIVEPKRMYLLRGALEELSHAGVAPQMYQSYIQLAGSVYDGLLRGAPHVDASGDAYNDAWDEAERLVATLDYLTRKAPSTGHRRVADRALGFAREILDRFFDSTDAPA